MPGSELGSENTREGRNSEGSPAHGASSLELETEVNQITQINVKLQLWKSAKGY